MSCDYHWPVDAHTVTDKARALKQCELLVRFDEVLEKRCLGLSHSICVFFYKNVDIRGYIN